ncbi:MULTISPECIES: hypothetical protein [Rhodococcus]|uniref:Uncharacterized protein n=1 Tax=Rhodococcus cerastii TaxID=908616 RepID=A0ABU4CYB4_9NOCA|nr:MULTISPECIES: hypothetical protein [Rhodococcus]MDV6302448.1 hypothetical protein [Rhodococcus cerastii]MDV7990565.1 hypothetical protein [Rhodococcus sp. IEGM 1374]
MIIDCSDCLVRAIACADCVVTVLLGPPGMPSGSDGRRVGPPSRITLEQEELGAMGVLADVGLVPTLKLVVNDDDIAEVPLLSTRDTPGDQRAG